MSYETADAQKEEFRKYLEKNGVIQQLTRVLVGLYEEPERPSNAIDFIKKFLGAPIGVDIDELRAENEELKRKNDELQRKVDELLQQLEQLQAEDDK
uniref:c-Myc-binding protein n=1 Tax=Chromera velia CCMP2878 TaxID=1169474 RepID=A0A0G4F9H2_9ALVE|mmetsp:Transcript_37028/g.72825  ORF Transcript_37028/g.72825 Transcript_37028/m.72825 type:complete len:97 (-) Transcript_37028:454-744(-)|eukprot:Cvel_15894.t1-p1 / transcript=Cvel_15894.t1 / gene=Cvel_15894 / organism=Chromera_velia_CCMP2878 / gene_product=C-Myc-binding protein homolog, putative / transcript_product=C-Myc-binding protein homolog, putative / location=Cvel_scaffold1200:40793-41614(+) / protein_length=96 / sequence_SO=supercontig / SO=protein_coding / is_pseudo=false